MSDLQFVNLHVHSAIGSMLDSMVRVNELFDCCKEINQPAIAITDHGTCCSYFDLYKEYVRTGLKGIPGIEAYFVHDLEDKKEKNKHIVLLAMNEKGCRNILRLNYEGFCNGRIIYMKMFPRISWAQLEKYSEGVICLSGCSNGILARHIQNDEPKLALRDAQKLLNIFGDRLYLEVQPHSFKSDNLDQYRVNKQIYNLHKHTGIPIVATNDVHYLRESDHKYHDMLLAIGDRCALQDENRKRYINEFYLKGANHILKYFGEELGTYLCNNTMEVAERCDPPDYLKHEKGVYNLPKFPVKDEKDYEEFCEWKKNEEKDLEEDVAYLRFKCVKNFKKINVNDKNVYWDRVKSEIKVLEEKNLSSYMLIVADYIKAAKDRGCPVGPARGSSAGSVVAMILGITTIDPIKYGLMFERFVNPLREQLADIDTDFGNPQVVKDYLLEKYGKEYVASIANIMYLTPKVVVTDIIRTLRVGGDKSESFKIAKQITDTIPENIKKVEEAFEISSGFRDWMMKYPEVYTYSLKLQNLPRQHGIHAAGVVISDRPLPDYLPLKVDRHGVVATQYEKDRIEECGFLKIDALGLETLNVLAATKNLIAERGKKLRDEIPMDDKKTYDLISEADTLGVFQLESSLASLCKILKPKSIEEISDINALGRPGSPPEEREDFINRKLKRIPAKPLHPKLKDALQKTCHKVVYEEDLLALGKYICGWDLGESDIMRRICKGKQKTAHKLPELKKKFVRDAFKNGVREEDADKLFEIVKYFSGYGFNKSHSISYSTISYETAYYKAHYTTEFFVGLLNSSDPNKDEEKIKMYQTEMRAKGIEIFPPDINKSKEEYSIEAPKRVRIGLGSIKGVGDKAVESIIENQPYKDVIDFVKKINHNKVNIGVVRCLIDAGCFDKFGITRKALSTEYEGFRKKFKEKKEKIEEFKYEFNNVQEWDLKEKLERERAVLGDYFSGSIDDVYGGFFVKDPRRTKLDALPGLEDGRIIRVEGLIRKKIKVFKIKKQTSKNFGKAFAKYLIEDLDKNLADLTVWPEQYKDIGPLLKNNTPIIFTAKVSSFGEKKSLEFKTIVKI